MNLQLNKLIPMVLQVNLEVACRFYGVTAFNLA
jgi:hypothetical protein